MRYVLVLILSCFSIIGYAQNFVISDNDSTITTEYNDGKLWAYRYMNGYVVGLTCYESRMIMVNIIKCGYILTTKTLKV